MERIEVNIATGVREVITLTSGEEAAALARQAMFDADNTQDKRAMRAIDSTDRLQFELLFDHENRVRTIEARQQITRAQFRQALIDRWKVLNA